MNRKIKRALKSIGLSKPTQQDKQEIRNSYFQACAEAGELQYKIKEFNKALEQLNQRISNLNKEYSKMLVPDAQETPAEPKQEEVASVEANS